MAKVKHRKALNAAFVTHANILATNSNCRPEKDVVVAVVERYCEIARATILAGFEWAVPINFSERVGIEKVGELKICVHKTIERDAHKIDPSTGRKIYNPRRPNEKHRIVWNSELLKKRKLKFVPSNEMRHMLEDILLNTHQDYRLAQ